jgi:hypothetical protein
MILEGFSSCPNSTHFCWNPGKTHLIPLIAGLMMSWQVSWTMCVCLGHIKSVCCWGYLRTEGGKNCLTLRFDTKIQELMNESSSVVYCSLAFFLNLESSR